MQNVLERMRKQILNHFCLELRFMQLLYDEKYDSVQGVVPVTMIGTWTQRNCGRSKFEETGWMRNIQTIIVPTGYYVIPLDKLNIKLTQIACLEETSNVNARVMVT